MNGEDLSGFSMLELFQAEVSAHAAALDEDLVQLESNPTDPARLEALMRAAHSIKGAARIVGVDPAVKVAHAMEDCFVAAQQGGIELGSAAIDALLAGADALRTIGTLSEAAAPAWFESETPRLAALVEAIRAASRGETPARASAPAVASAVSPASERPSEPPATSGASLDAPPEPPPEAPPPAVSGARGDGGNVRVHAASLARMLAYAGESVVGARRLGVHASSMERLKLGVAQLGTLVDRLADRIGEDRSGGAREAIGAVQLQLGRVRRSLADDTDAFDVEARRSEDLSGRMYREVLVSRMRPFGDGAAGFPRLVRDVAKELGKRVQLEIVGRNVQVDRDILERLDAPLGHMLRNALDHGIEAPDERRRSGKPEQGTLCLTARHADGMLEVELRDDGRGVDLELLRERVIARGLIPAEIAPGLSSEELLEFLFLPGFSSKGSVTEISGRGVGLDVVHGMVKNAGGVIRTSSEPGRGMRFLLVLPITRSVIRAAIASIGNQTIAFPLTSIEHLVRLDPSELHDVEGRQHFRYQGAPVGLVPAAELLGLPGSESATHAIYVVVLASGTDRYGLVVDALLGEQDLVARPLDPRLGDVAMISAAALDENGDVVLIADVQDLLRAVDQLLYDGRLRRIHVTDRGRTATRRKRVLVVDDSITVREVERNRLMQRGYDVDVAVDGSDGWKSLRASEYDLVITDVDMPRMNGIELVRRIKQDPKLSRIPVMIVSYKDREEDRMRGLEAGADAYMTKGSFHDEVWLATVVDLIGEPDTDDGERP